MCRTICVIIFLSASGCEANVAKVKYRQNVQGIIVRQLTIEQRVLKGVTKKRKRIRLRKGGGQRIPKART